MTFLTILTIFGFIMGSFALSIPRGAFSEFKNSTTDAVLSNSTLSVINSTVAATNATTFVHTLNETTTQTLLKRNAAPFSNETTIAAAIKRREALNETAYY
ncbi:uncharacterized protein V2V93DRAFT_369580 [Kockiozyma suomiensis]|uniref:uncharacterized protein n=1 Tax=Kockiozyma suomiensis TaxID=1337062 RepID=UPI00334317C5